MAETHVISALKRKRAVIYGQLVEKLADIGVDEKEVIIRNKLARGKFSAVVLVQCMTALGTERLRLD